MTTSSTLTRSKLEQSLRLVELKPGLKFSVSTLKELLPDVEAALFFGKVYNLDYTQLSTLLHTVLDSPVADALFSGDHSTVLQSYLIGGYEHDEYCLIDEGDDCTCDPVYYPGVVGPAQKGDVAFNPEVPKGEILPEVWKSLEVEVAKSIKEVASKLSDVVARMPGKQGKMVFNSMMVMNRKRPTIGDYRPSIHHERQKKNLLILDVSGSMSRHTVEMIVDDVVAMSYMANADFAIVSNNCFYWEAGTYDSAAILAKSEFGGTQYEQLSDLLQQDWGTVITVADYDSSRDAQRHIKANCKGHIDEVFDISLVNRPTFLAECVGQLAAKVTPTLIGKSQYILT